MDFEELSVTSDSSVEIARLLLLHGSIYHLLL
jgi:hypothetical protein